MHKPTSDFFPNFAVVAQLRVACGEECQTPARSTHHSSFTVLHSAPFIPVSGCARPNLASSVRGRKSARGLVQLREMGAQRIPPPRSAMLIMSKEKVDKQSTEKKMAREFGNHQEIFWHLARLGLNI